uniref:Toll-like receptor 2 n=1 Tax=Crassostrea virginica TaxID=6565 RepID=A0A8B8AK35_CRAVI|nr:toll-like receptor 2 [Crassostrea virginica]
MLHKMRSHICFLAFFLYMGLLVLADFCCPQTKCFCSSSSDCKWLVDCSELNLKKVPPKFPSNVTCINLSGNMLTEIKGSSFQELENLWSLDLSKNKLKTVEKGAFVKLRKLEHLDISSNNNLGLSVLKNVTDGLNQTNIKVFKVNQISCPAGRSTILRRAHLINLDNTSLLELSIADNRIEMMEPCVLYNLPKSIKRLNIASNRLIAAKYVLEYTTLAHVEVINASLRNSPAPFLTSLARCEENLDTSENYNDDNLCHVDRPWSSSNWLISITVPAFLDTLYVNSSKIFSQVVKFKLLPNKLRRVYLQDNIIHSWAGPMYGVENITVLDMSRNFCARICKDIAVNLHGLITLNLSENALGSKFQFDVTGKIMRNLRRLQYLDISNNRIQALPYPFFKNLNSIVHLKVSNNLLSEWKVAMRHMLNLTTLDLSQNRLGTISTNGMSDLSLLFARGNLSINLKDNRLLCTCDNLNFLEWMSSNRAHFVMFHLYTCSKAQKSGLDFKQFDKSIAKLKDMCKSYTVYYIIISVTATCISSLAIFVVLYRNRWKIRYLRYTLLQRGLRNGNLLRTNGSDEDFFLYDAFVSYTSKDREFVIRDMIQNLEELYGLRLLIRDRSFLPGEPKCQQIVRSIQESKKTLCVVSKRFLKSAWRDYELNMARVEGVEARKTLKYVVLILLPEVYNGGYPKKISDFLKKNCFIEYPDDPTGYEEFWQNLSNTLQENSES